MAQLNTPSFLSKWETLFADNVSRVISEGYVRDFRQDISDSFMNFLSDVLDEDDMASNSAIKLATQQSIKAYSDTKWPSAGTFDLTGALTIDGNDNDLIFGSPNRLNDFQVYADNAIVIDALSGTDQASVNIDPLNGINLDVSFLGGGGSFVINQSGSTFGADNGVETSGLTLGPDAFHLHIEDTGGSHYHIDAGIPTGLSLIADDGVDSSTLSISPSVIDVVSHSISLFSDETSTFLGYDDGTNGANALFDSTHVLFTCTDGSSTSTFQLLPTGFSPPQFTVATAPSASPSGKIAFCSDESGGPIIVFSDGTDWRRSTDGSIIS